MLLNLLQLSLLSIIGFTHPALEPYHDLIKEISAEYSINARVVATIIMVESRGDNNASNESGAVCLMGINSHVGGRPSAKQLKNNPRLCLDWGAKILRGAMNQAGNLNDSLMIYNVGLQGWRNCLARGQGMIVLYNKYWSELWINWGEE